jgi:HAE1 family hydrophobic/amphiphilic exporter-1
MNFVSRKVSQSIKLVVSASLTMVLGASFPLSVFAQDGVREGIIAKENQVAQPQTAKPAETAAKKDVAKVEPKADEKAETSSGVATPSNVESGVVMAGKTGLQQQGGQNPNQNSITQPLALSPEVGTQRVGVNPDQKQALSMQEAIAMGLQNNLDIESFRQGVQISQYNLFSSYGVYDTVSGANIFYRSQTFPVSSVFGGGNASASLTQKSLNYNFNTAKQLERGGGFYQIDFNNSRTNTSSTASTLTTQYNPTLTLTFTQPLMRNFKTDVYRRAIQINKRSLDLSDSQFRQRVIEIISSIQRAYWDLVFAIKNEQIARDTVELTRTQLSNNQKQVDAGTLAPIELRSTEAALESRKGDVILALQSITTAENTLKGLLNKDPNDKMWYSQLIPTDDPALTPPTYSLEESVALALKNRQELEQIKLQAQQKDIDLKYYENQTKPQIDLVGSYGNTGLAGAPSTVVRDSGGGFDPTTVDLVNSLNQARAGLGLPPFVLPEIPTTSGAIGDSVPTRFRGGYFRSLANLFGQDFRNYQIGVTISFPWRNRTAEGNIGRVLAESRQLDARQRQLVQNIQIDVRNALQAVVAAKQLFESQQANRIAANAQYNGELEKFRAGLSTNFFVLQRQTDLSVARGNEIRALTDYNKALADLQRVTGLTLISNNVQVTSPENPDIK